MSKPNCYTCRHRRNVPGDAHSSCQLGVDHFIHSGPRPMVQGNSHGIRQGWFFWPVNFDPIWLESCDSYATTVVDKTRA